MRPHAEKPQFKRQNSVPPIVPIVGLLAIAVAVSVLVGWAFDFRLLKTIRPGFAAMKPNSAIAFLLAGICLVLWSPRGHRLVSELTQAAALVILLIGGATLIEYAATRDLGIDQLLALEKAPLVGSSSPSRPAAAAAFNFVLIGFSLLLLPRQYKFVKWLIPCLALTCMSVVTLALLGYLYGTPALYRVGFYSSMAIHTAATFFVLSIGVLYARDDFHLMATLRSSGAGGIAARKLLPSIVALPALLGWLILLLRSKHVHFFDGKMSFAALAFLTMALLVVVVYRVSSTLNRLDHERRSADAATHRVREQSEERLRIAQQVAGIGTFERNLQTGISLWSPEFEAMYGLKTGEIPHSKEAWEQLVHLEDRAHALALVERALTTGEPQEGEWRAVCPDGTVHWLVGRFQLFKDADGKPLRIIGANIDITSRKAVEQSLDAHRQELAHVLRLNTMGEMATGLAHEINQPLSAIQNYARGAIRRLNGGGCDSSQLIEVATSIADESARAAAIVHNLTHYVKKGDSEHKLIDLNSIVRNATRTIAVEAERRGITVDLQPANQPQLVRGDSIQLEQVVINLLLNGVQAMENGDSGKRLFAKVAADNANVIISVADDGPGIAPNHIEQIFKPFYTTKPNGLGMGLAISRSIIESHCGQLWAESNPPGGATFHICLPASQELASVSKTIAGLCDSGSSAAA